MSTMLTPGQTLNTATGLPCQVEKLLGSGGQGEVYQVKLGGQSLALKWYHPEAATRDQLDRLGVLVKKGPPSEHFLWPIDILTGRDGRFGYLMMVRDKRFASGQDLMRRRVDPSFRVLSTIGVNLAVEFLHLHSRGLSYCDISFGNVFFDPATGEILICDNDNVVIDGTPVPIGGTPRFMAPEIVRREAMPDSRTDLYSLSVLLFYLFMMHHPLDGHKEAEIRCLDLPALTKLYGTQPLFCFDPADESNRPVPGVHDNALALWPLYPEFFRKLFIQSFTIGLHHREERVRESEWRAALARMRDGIIYCQCRSETFYAPAADDAPPAPAPTCWACRKRVPLPPILYVGRHAIMLNYDTKLYPHHLDDQKLYDFSAPCLEVNVHPQDATRWGLKNLTAQPWQATLNDGRTVIVEPQKSVALQHGLAIRFGRLQGQVRSLS